eukprot:4692051-Alexandrium_andersonii.AAC.1
MPNIGEHPPSIHLPDVAPFKDIKHIRLLNTIMLVVMAACRCHNHNMVMTTMVVVGEPETGA